MRNSIPFFWYVVFGWVLPEYVLRIIIELIGARTDSIEIDLLKLKTFDLLNS